MHSSDIRRFSSTHLLPTSCRMRKEFEMEAAETSKDWRELYEEAVLEHDPERLGTRIALAHKAIQERTRQLWYEGSQEMSEREHLEAAFHYLEILHSLAGKRGQAA